MAIEGMATLHALSTSNLTVEDPAADVRGRKVLDNAGQDVGSVDDLMIDNRDRKVRFLVVASGGFLGLGETKCLIPVDAVTQVTDEAVHVDQTREHVAGAPGYDPELVADVGYWDRVYGHYGYPPYWAGDYADPPYPWLPRDRPPAGRSPRAQWEDDGGALAQQDATRTKRA